MNETKPPHHRRSIRLPGYDYRQNGAYFVTIVTQDRDELFGCIKNGEMIANHIGQVAMKKWIWLAERFPYVELGEYCLMPNHFHGILMISTVGAVREPPLPEMTTKPLGRLIGAYKTVSTKWINQQRGSPGAVVWQRNYF